MTSASVKIAAPTFGLSLGAASKVKVRPADALDMNQPPKPPYRPTPGAMPRGRGPLRLVPQLNPQSPPLVDASATSTEGGQTTVTGTVKAPRPQSHLAKFLTAYADAIDRDIKLILEL